MIDWGGGAERMKVLKVPSKSADEIDFFSNLTHFLTIIGGGGAKPNIGGGGHSQRDIKLRPCIIVSYN